MKFSVAIREVHINTLIVEAATADEARRLAQDSSQCGELEYSHTMDIEHTTAEPVPDDTHADIKASDAKVEQKGDIDPDDLVEHEERWDTFVD